MSDHRQPGIRILGVGLYGRGSFYRVLWSVLEPLAARFDIHYLGLGWNGPRHQRSGIEVYPSARGFRYDGSELDELLTGLRPDLVLLAHEIRLAASLAHSWGGRPQRPALVGYSPIEGRILQPAIVRPLSGLDRMVVYTESARRQIERCWQVRPNAGTFERPPRIEVIPCGVDLDVFYPLGRLGDPECRRLARQRAFPGLPADDDAFVVLNGSQCAPRKRLDITLWGFANFVRDKPANVYLYLHRAGPGCRDWAAIEGLASRLGILDRLIPAAQASIDGELSSAELNWIYNACDVGVNSSMAEGWGLVSFEHAATGAAQIVPGHSSPGELWRGAARILPTRYSYPSSSVFEMSVVPSSALTQSLEELYRDRQLLASLARASYERAVESSEWTWSAVAERFSRLFTELVSHRRESREHTHAQLS